jgi:tryptophan synthase alpha subunit
MEATGKKSAIKTVLTIAAGVVVGLAIVKGLDYGFKKITKKA